jgi:hypothetical protein
MSLAETVRACLAANDIEGALITTWRKTRAVVIAELVDAIDRTDRMPAFTGDTKAWLAAAKSAATHRERGALLRWIADRPASDIHQGSSRRRGTTRGYRARSCHCRSPSIGSSQRVSRRATRTACWSTPTRAMAGTAERLAMTDRRT